MKNKYPAAGRFVPLLILAAGLLQCYAIDRDGSGLKETRGGRNYEWTTDHMQFGVRWQPFAGFPGNNAYDVKRPVIAKESGYAQFWVNWAAVEPEEKNTDYAHNMSPELRAIEQAVDACVARGLKVELVFWHCPAWASASGQAGGWKPKPDEFKKFATRMARHFKNRVDAYQLYHEANQKAMMQDGNIDEMMSEIFIKGARAIRKVYSEAPARPVLVSTSGISPCEACPALGGLKGKGAEAALDFYDRLIANKKLMGLVDALNMNVSDHYDGYGSMDGSRIPSVWANYDIVRRKLDEAGYRNKKILASESWVVWDNGPSAVDANGDGLVNEQDAYAKTVTILGRCLERGLNTINLPWSDNSSGWAMGLTKRRDYNGRIKKLRPDMVIPAGDGGADIVTRKIDPQGTDQTFTIHDGAGTIFKEENYIDPSNPNHLHYYIWRWYAQVAGGTDQVIRHALAGEAGNDIGVVGLGFTGSERYRIASYNRTQKNFTVLLYASGATGKSWAVVKIPAKIQNGAVYNNKYSKTDFRGEGFEDGERYDVRIETKDIDQTTGADVDVRILNKPGLTVKDGTLEAPIESLNKFTTITFTRSNATAVKPATP
jgi:hypothetical protein